MTEALRYREGFEALQRGENQRADDLMGELAVLGYAPAVNHVGEMSQAINPTFAAARRSSPCPS